MRRFALPSLLLFVFLSCQKDNSKTEIYFKLPKKLKEVSGISYSEPSKLLWAIEDSGNKNIIYGITLDGKVFKKILVSNVENTDWEDITSDDAGSLYIGDFGNNDNLRKDLAIYKVNQADLAKDSVLSVQKTAFYYPEQTDFPPKKKQLFFDCEAFFEKDGFFYLFTKNRSKNFDGTTFLYKIPNKEGSFVAERLGEFKTCSDYNNCCITSAALSPDKSKVVLLGHSKVWLFEDFKGDAFFKGKVTELQLDNYTQKEAICFLNNETLLIADERNGKTGGNAYKVSLAKLKSKP